MPTTLPHEAVPQERPTPRSPRRSAYAHRSTKPTNDQSPTDKKAEALYDSALVARFNHSGDQSAFREIVQRYYGRIVAVAQQVLHNAAEAQDIAQETFIRAHRGLANFRGEAALASWLYCIALNLSRNRYWHFFCRRHHQTFSIDQLLIDDSSCPLADLLPDSVPDPRRETMSNEFVVLVAQCMNQLDAPHREILVLRNVLHHSYDEIGVALSLNVSTVKSRLARARAKLRTLILKVAPDFGDDAEMTDFFEPTHSLPTRLGPLADPL